MKRGRLLVFPRGVLAQKWGIWYDRGKTERKEAIIVAKRSMSLLMVMIVLLAALSGCVDTRLLDWMNERPGYHEKVAYADMVYTRPDMVAFQQTLSEVCLIADQGRSLDKLVDGIYDFYEVYDSFYTNYYLADIKYSADLTDAYWQAEYEFCMENAGQADAGLEELMYALASSPLREALEGPDFFGEGYFDSYEGENPWDANFLALLEQEAELQSKYYTLTEQANSVTYYSEEYFTVYGTQMAELFVELVEVRQQLAAAMGYDSYPQFAYTSTMTGTIPRNRQ